MSRFEALKYEIIPTESFKIIRNCSGCGNKSIYHNTNKIRINANGTQIDVWLIYQCDKCKHTYNLPIYSRINRNELEKWEYDAFVQNSQKIVDRYALDRNIFQKNAAMIFNEPDYILKAIGTSDKENSIQFFNPYKIRVRYDKLIAESLKISRTRAKMLLETGTLKKSNFSDNELIFAY